MSSRFPKQKIAQRVVTVGMLSHILERAVTHEVTRQLALLHPTTPPLWVRLWHRLTRKQHG